MKKFLLSSIIMLGVCGAVSAQDATSSKLKKNNAVATNSLTPAPTPQKSTIAPASDDVAPAAAPRTAADKEAAAVAPTRIKTKPVQAKATVSVNAEGVVMTDEEKEKAEKMKAAENEKKNQQ